MTFTIQLCFSNEALAHLKPVFLEIDSPIIRKGDRPHLSLSVFEGEDIEEIRDILGTIASEVAKFPITFSAIGIFPSSENVVFLAPIVTQRLLDIHSMLHSHLNRLAISPWKYYTPNFWVPHVAISLGSASDKDRILNALCEKPIWRDYLISAIEFIRCSPGKLLHRVELAAQGAAANP